MAAGERDQQKRPSMHAMHRAQLVQATVLFRHYLLGKKFTLHVDHVVLLYLVSKQSLTGKLAQWMLLLQEFDFDIQH